MDFTNKILIMPKLLKYLKDNPNRLTPLEKDKILFDIEKYFDDNSYLTPDIYDFFRHLEKIENLHIRNPRHQRFLRYLNAKYNLQSSPKKILEVGAGRMCELSQELSKNGNILTAIDPAIQLSNQEAHEKGFNIIKHHFNCGKYPVENHCTSLKPYDLGIAHKACKGTEHLLIQGLIDNKPVEAMLCNRPHKSLDGERFKNMEEYIKHLKSISSEIKVFDYANNIIATNN